MKIVKTSEDTTYFVKNTTHYFEVDGCIVRVYVYSKYSEYDDEYEYEADEDDLEELTEEQRDIFNDNLYDFIKMVAKEEKIITNE